MPRDTGTADTERLKKALISGTHQSTMQPANRHSNTKAAIRSCTNQKLALQIFISSRNPFPFN